MASMFCSKHVIFGNQLVNLRGNTIAGRFISRSLQLICFGYERIDRVFRILHR